MIKTIDTVGISNPRILKTALLGSFLAAAALTASAQAPTPTPAPAPVPVPVKVPAWDTSAALGFTLTRGNSDTLLLTGNILTAKKWDKNELSFGSDGAYGENNGDKNAESLHGFGQYNRLFTERIYGYLRLDGLHDAIADVDYRFTFGPGVGYYFIKEENTKLSGEFGPAFIVEKLGDTTKGYLTLRLAERFEQKLNARAKIWQTLEILPQVDDFNNYILNAELGVETSLTDKLSLRTYLQDGYDNQPASGRDKNDLKLVTAIAYKF